MTFAGVCVGPMLSIMKRCNVLQHPAAAWEASLEAPGDLDKLDMMMR